MSGLTQTLKNDFNGDIDLTEESIIQTSRDASVFEVRPAGVLAPRTVVDIESAVKWATRETAAGNHVSLAPRVGGTCTGRARRRWTGECRRACWGPGR